MVRRKQQHPQRVPPKKTKEEKFITQEENDFLDEYTVWEHAPKPIRRNSDRLSIPEVRMKFKSLDGDPTKIQQCFDIFIRRCIGLADGDLEKTRIDLGLFHGGFREQNGFWLTKRTHKSMDGNVLMNEIERMCQSNKELSIDLSFSIALQIYKEDYNLKGGCQEKQVLIDTQKQIKSTVLGKGYCMAKAIAIGKQWADLEGNLSTPVWKYLIKSAKPNLTASKQLAAAKKIIELTDINPERSEHDIRDLAKFAAALPDYRIILYHRPPFQKFYSIRMEFNTTSEKIIPIAYYAEHYDFFKPTQNALNTTYCHKCRTFGNSQHFKTCNARCQKCGFIDCTRLLDSAITCEDCHTQFPNDQCYKQHKDLAYNVKKSKCQSHYTCPDCFKYIDTGKLREGEVHICENRWRCISCDKMYANSRSHDCCFEPPTEKQIKAKKEAQEKFTILFYDVETIVTDSSQGPDRSKPQPEHVVNLICYKITCEKCTMGSQEPCDCETNHMSYNTHDDPLGAFCKFLLQDKRLNNAYVIAHNGGRYDHNFVLFKCLKDYNVLPTFISNGTTIIMGDISPMTRSMVGVSNKLYFRDSYQWLAMALATMPKAFGIPELKKGYYPYFFNHPNHYGKKYDRLPAQKYYDVEFMKVGKTKEFQAWYAEHEFDEFDADYEILTYCQSDVEILAAAVQKFMKICIERFNGWNPILNSCTLASFVLFLMKHEHIKEGDLGIIPERGFPERFNSELALKHMFWLEKMEDIKIHHKLRGPEKEIVLPNGQKTCVDGYDESTNTIYEIHGCAFHGCKQCFNPEAKNIFNKFVTNESLYNKTMKRDADLKDLGYNVRVFWEHEIRTMLKTNSEMKKFFENCRHTTNLLPRDAMFGGRTQPFQMLMNADKDYELCYLDFCSLYPFVNMTKEYPRGSPNVIKNNFHAISDSVKYRGLIHCSILPKADILLPVLPYRARGKLLFPTCRMCAETNKWTTCPHTKVSERYLTGTWTSIEINAALSRGYKLLQYHEVWHWNDSQWRVGGFFKSYLKPMLQMKHEASGFPRSDMTEAEKDEHIAMIERTDGVTLSKANIVKNPTLRTLAKLFLNSCWGKFAENPVRAETGLFATADAVGQAEFMNAPGYEYTRIVDWPTGHTLITRTSNRTEVAIKPFTSIVIGALTTAYARLTLYNAMEKVGGKLLGYVDTDSLLFLKKRNSLNPLEDLCGVGLGRLESEIPEGYEMKKVVCMAPKVYAYTLENGVGDVKNVIKFKGVCLNNSTSKAITLETMEKSIRKLLENGTTEPIVADDNSMKRQLLGPITSIRLIKKLLPVMDKVHVNDNGTTLPLGYADKLEPTSDYPF